MVQTEWAGRAGCAGKCGRFSYFQAPLNRTHSPNEKRRCP
jgi:hypothetical protein